VEKIKATEFVEGLFAVRSVGRPRASDLSEEAPQEDAPKSPETPLPASSAYFTTSESKARFLTRYSQHITSTPLTDDIQVKKVSFSNN
jgi:hypothetical protein